MSEQELIRVLVEIDDGTELPRTHLIENVVSWGRGNGYFSVRIREDGKEDRLLWFAESKIIRIETPWVEPQVSSEDSAE